jgi:hypothetical protein
MSIPASNRLASLSRIQDITDSLRMLALTGLQHFIHAEFARGHLTPADLHMLQQEMSGVTDHLATLSDICESEITPEPHGTRDTFVPHPTDHPVCDSCNHDLELNADFRCVRCGA